MSLDFVVPIGATGAAGEQGAAGPKGDTGASPTVEVGEVSAGEAAAVTANATETGVPLNFVVPFGPTGAAGPTGVTGAVGEQGSVGQAGPMGATPTVVIGTVTTSTDATANVAASDTETGVTLDFVIPQGPAGEAGPKGDPGAAPVITVTESTPTSYKVSFKTPDQEVVSLI